MGLADASGRSELSRRAVLRRLGVAGVLGPLGLSATDGVAATGAGSQGYSPPDRPGGNGPHGTSPLPGPAVLYDSLASAPQLENASGSRWAAPPLLVCGADAYLDGEYVYQDYVYDDYGADTAPLSVPAEPHTDENSTGDLRYPTDADTYAYNAADLLEFRAMPTDDGVAYRVRLNTMLEPDVAGVAIGIDTGAGAGGGGRSEWGYGIGSLGDLGLDHVVAAWGTGAELDGEPLECHVDLERNQLEVDVPLDPAGATWRHYVVVGLFDADRGVFEQVQNRPSETEPGGANGQSPPPIFNVGFRFDEPLGGGPGQFADYRDVAQATALADRDISSLYADVDFSKLRPPTVTEYLGPTSGFLNRLYASRLDRGEGVDAARGQFVGPVQPYGVYVPEGYSGDPTPMHLDLHAATNTHNDFAVSMPNRVQAFGEARDAIVLTPFARGTSGFYLGDHAYAVFEAWNDLAHRYKVDVDRVTVGGHSMGSYGTYRFLGRYPDLFAGAFTTTGATGDTFTDRSAVTGQETPDVSRLTESLRHVPLMMWYGAADELVPLPTPLRYGQRLRDHGYRHELDVFMADHFTWPQLDEWDRAGEFLEAHDTVTRTPARVTFRRVPDYDEPDLGLVADGAYWISGIEVVDGATSGLVDAESDGVDEPEPVPVPYESAGTEPLPYVARGTRWDNPDTGSTSNTLTMTLEDVTGVTVWVEESKLDPTAELTLVVDSTTRATLTFAGSFGRRTVTVESGHSVRTIRLVGSS